MARTTEILPPRSAPKVTAGLTWPPEVLMLEATAANRAKACASAITTRSEGDVVVALDILSASSYCKLILFRPSLNIKNKLDMHKVLLSVLACGSKGCYKINQNK